MPRSSFIIFNILLVAALFGFIYLTGSKRMAVQYTVVYFFLPYVLLMLLSAFIAMIRFFMSEEPERNQTAGSFFRAAVLVSGLVFGAVKLMEYYKLLQ